MVIHINALAIHLNGGAHSAFKISKQIMFLLVITPFLVMSSPLGASSLPVPVTKHVSTISDSTDVNLSSVFNDLRKEGLFKVGGKAVFVGNRDDYAVTDHRVLADNNVDLISPDDLNMRSSVPDDSLDLTFSYDLKAMSESVDRTLKVGGVAVIQLPEGLSSQFEKPSNFKIVYVRRFQSIILAMRKIAHGTSTKFCSRRSLLGHTAEARKAVLDKLEDVLLEPPRGSSQRSDRYLKRTKFLPDLMGDSLESYPRRVFIDIGLTQRKGGTSSKWFVDNYPTRNLDFETYMIETIPDEISGKEVTQEEKIGMSDWLKKNVKEEEYVVMKAEAEVVDDMVRNKATNLVDELFLECKPSAGKGNRRAYWECLALYGRLRDEGVAVHQWWD